MMTTEQLVPKEATWRIGLLGLGVMGKRHLEAYARLHGVEVVTRTSSAYAGFDPNNKWKLGEAMASDPSLHAIDICLPTPLHRIVAVTALEAGKHVICEKPMALHVSDCLAMIDAAKQNNRVLMVAHVLRFWPAYRALDAAIRSQQYGPVQGARFTRSSSFPTWGEWLRRLQESGGATLDLLVHDFDQVLSLFGAPWAASAEKLSGGDGIKCVLHYESGLKVEVEGGWFEDSRPFAMGFQVRAGNGELVFQDDGLSLHRIAVPIEEIALPLVDPYAEQLSYFADCCRRNCPPLRPSSESSAAAVELAYALDALARNNPQSLQKIYLSTNVRIEE
jgi:predicted dehydrogenase